MQRYVLIILLLAGHLLPFTLPAQAPYILMVSLDGFRWDYPEKVDLPTFRHIEQSGARADAIIPCFPTKTFPNHYSMATGLHPDKHGIVMNSFYDPVMDASYTLSDRDAVMNASFYGGEPIWVTAELQGITTASYFWVGSEAPVKGIQPTYWKPYQHNFPYENRIDSVIAWFSLPLPERPSLVLLYFDEPDGVGHAYGPDAKETYEVIARLDSLMGDMIKKLKTLPIYDSLNIIITSDHGMGPISTDRAIELTHVLDTAWILRARGGNPGYNLQVKPGFLDSVMTRLENTPNLKAWRTGEAPERLNYSQHPRLLDLTVVADSAWSIYWKASRTYSGGTHGYDNANTDMHAIFYAMGPAFQKGVRIPAFNNIDLYPMLAHILGIKPAPVDGRLENVLPALVPKP